MQEETVLSAHPVSDAMRATVLEQLSAIESRQQVVVLFACESGSRGWGFASPDSDYDVRFVYVHRLPWYLTVDAGRNVIEQPISGELDICGWELRKALGLLADSNPTLLEWLRSPILYRAGESATSPRWPGIHAFIEQELAEAMAYVPEATPKAGLRPQLDRYLQDAVRHFDAPT